MINFNLQGCVTFQAVNRRVLIMENGVRYQNTAFKIYGWMKWQRNMFSSECLNIPYQDYTELISRTTERNMYSFKKTELFAYLRASAGRSVPRCFSLCHFDFIFPYLRRTTRQTARIEKILIIVLCCVVLCCVVLCCVVLCCVVLCCVVLCCVAVCD